MFKKKKTQTQETPVTPETVTEASDTQDQPKEFQKNIKTLWVYTSLFCVFALVLIFVSSFFQEKRDKENEDLREQVEKHELVLSNNQSTIKNIESEISTYKQINDILTQRNDYLETQADIDKDFMVSATEIIQNADYLLTVGHCLDVGDKDTARANLAAVDTNYLTDAMRITYDKYAQELAAE